MPLTHAVLARIREAVSSLHAVSRVSIHDLPNRDGVLYGDAAFDPVRAVDDCAAAAISDRAAHSRGRAEVAPKESRNSDHGRAADWSFDPAAIAALVEFADTRGVGIAGRISQLRLRRIPGRFRESAAQAEPGTDRDAEVPVGSGRGAVRRRAAVGHECEGIVFNQHERAVPQGSEPGSAGSLLVEQSVGPIRWRSCFFLGS